MSWYGDERVRVEDILPPPPPVNVLVIQLHLKMGLATVIEEEEIIGHNRTHTADKKSKRPSRTDELV